MKNTLIILVFLFSIHATSCNNLATHSHDGSYAMNIVIYGVSANLKTDLIVDGDRIKMFDKIGDCKQYVDKIVVGDGSVIINVVEGDLIMNSRLGKIKYVRTGNATSF